MIFANVRLPDAVRIALEEGTLVIFAGAGISMPPPSNLPSFNALAREINGLSPVQIGKEDQILGKLARTGTNVHLAAARRLYGPHTRPTETHKQVLKLFGVPEKVRVVTTNFDNHFSDVARALFRKTTIREYHAPALPLGDDFNGIVYLHGSAKVNPHSMVLTDKNFGEAYLTRGWARDFLMSLFQKYTVLFIGYSHNDVTISYLARGLNSTALRRWALVSSDVKNEDEENWSRLEISVQQYPIDPSNAHNQHQSLTDFFTAWAKHTRESIFHRSKRIKSIGAGLPPENETVSEYLNYCIRHPQLAQDLCNSIRHPAWLGWFKAKGYLNDLLTHSTIELKNYDIVLAHWLSTYVRRKHPELLLELLQKGQQHFHPVFTQTFAHEVWRESIKSTDPRFSTWIAVLLTQGEHAIPSEKWGYLLQNCKIPEHTGIALRLFELLTTPRIRLQKHFSYPELLREPEDKKNKSTTPKKVDCEIDWPEGGKHWLGEAWEKALKPHLDKIAEPLSLLATKQIAFAHLIYRGENAPNATFDRLSWSRSSIAPHEQNREASSECLSLLIDIARDVHDYWLNTNPKRAHFQTESWWSSDLPLLRRLAIYGVSGSVTLSADDKLEWVLQNELIFAFGMKNEVFRILALAYPKASANTKAKLVRRIELDRRKKLARGLDLETRTYEQFNVLIWLRKADPQCTLIKGAIEEIHKIYPNFGERPHPDFDHWMGGGAFVDPKAGFDFDKILSQPPAVYLEGLTRASENSVRRDRWSYISNLKPLITRNKEWGYGFMNALISTHNVDMEIWNRVFWVWREIVHSADDWRQILDVAEQFPEERASFAGVTNLIADGVFKVEGKPDDEIVSRSAALMEKAWAVCSKNEEMPDDSYHDWLKSAINHEGGNIGQFWVHYCSHLWEKAGVDWNGIPPVLRGKMRDALNGKTRIKVYARIVMTQWIGYFYAWDKDFAVENLLPLLDWQRDSIVAQQTWSVLLNYRQGTSVELEEKLLPYYRQFAVRVTDMLKKTTERTDQFSDLALQNLGHYLAGLAVRVIKDPLRTGFFRDFLPTLPEFVRGALHQGIGDFLESCQPSESEGFWDRWLKEYLDLRIIGVPVALSYEETKPIADWCLFLGRAFPEAAERIAQMPLKGVFTYGIIDKLLKPPKDLILTEYPKECCLYLTAILKSEEYPLLDEKLVQLHGKLKGATHGTPEIRGFEELLFSRGWKK